MKRLLLFLTLTLTACSANAPILPTFTVAPPTALVIPSPTVQSSATLAPITQPSVAPDDLFAANGIQLPAPECDGNLTSSDAEGPYYTPDTPQRNSLLEPGMEGERLILVGYVLDSHCQPLPSAWLDFWQADANGDYDNSGFVLRGHQFADRQGRYFLETILPGLYDDRPIRHIHVKVMSVHGAPLITQLYFPEQAVAGLTVTIEEREGFLLAFFNFILAA